MFWLDKNESKVGAEHCSNSIIFLKFQQDDTIGHGQLRAIDNSIVKSN